MRIILASCSPRRKELLSETGIIFESVSPDYDEKIEDETFKYKKIEDIAYQKALSVLNKYSTPALIISADTVVIFNNKIIGKPKDEIEALAILKKLNASTHKVVTSICILNTQNKKYLLQSTTSEVIFNKLSEEDLKNYIKEYQPLDKAGAYGIQELPDYFIKQINGDFDNIVGLPCATLKIMLNKINTILN